MAPFGVPNDRVLGIAQAVAEGARFLPLILVTTGTGGDLVVLEGHVRLTAFMLSRDQLPLELEVLVGSSPAMTRWGAGSHREWPRSCRSLSMLPDFPAYDVCVGGLGLSGRTG